MEKEEKRNRFKGALWFDEAQKEFAIIGGCGGTGGFTSLFLNRAGVKTLVFDFDTFETHNLSGQLCGIKSIGKPKVEAVRDIVYELTGETMMVNNVAYDYNEEVNHIMFACFDSFEARKIMFENWRDYIEDLDEESEEYKKAIFIDLRCSPDVIQVVTITPNRIEEYDKYIWNDNEVEQPVCSYKQTTHCASMVASMAVSIFTNHLANYVIGEKVYSVPLFWEYILNTNECNNK